MKKFIALLLSVMLTASVLGACGKDKETGGELEPTIAEDDNKGNVKSTDKSTEEKDNTKNETDTLTTTDAANAAIEQFPSVVKNDNPSIEGGVLKWALVTDSAFAGVLNFCLQDDNYDSQITSWFCEPLISYDENFVADQDGAATYEYDADAKTITLHMREGVKWHDGEPVTLDDLVFAYEVICHKDYQGIYYSDNERNVIGAEEYHKGKADTISGLELSDDEMTLTIHFTKFYPSILVGGFWTNPMPRHYYEGIPVKEMTAHEKTRIKPIGFGPFKVKNVVPGESVEFERFDDYWMGRPKLDGVIVTVVKPELVPAAMQEGRYDVAQFSAQQYPDYKEPKNFQYIGEIQTVFNYTGFKLGKWDETNTINIYHPDSKMADINLRKAIGYAVNNAAIGEAFYNNLRFLATTIITPRHAAYQNKEMEGYNYNPEKAKQLLDEAGYKDIDGDGFREDPNGQKFSITWAMMEGENAETIAQYKIQCWAEVGLKVELYNGRLTEFNAFYDAVEMDDPAIDMYDAAWQTGYDPNPSQLWGHYASSNMTRYTSDKFDSIIDEISSDKAWDSEFLAQKYKEWQQAFFDEAPAIPSLWRIQLYAVNNRVKNYEVTANDIKQTYHLIELTAEDTIK